MGRCEHGVSTIADERCYECSPLTPGDFRSVSRVSDEELLRLEKIIPRTQQDGKVYGAILDLIELRALIRKL